MNFADLKNLLARHGFGNITAINHVAGSLREAGLIQAGTKTPMTAEDAVAMILGMSCRGTVREKFHNVEALLAMRGISYGHAWTDENRTFGALFAHLLRAYQPDQRRHSLSISPDRPVATYTCHDTYTADSSGIAYGKGVSATAPLAPVIWTVSISHDVLHDVALSLRA
ncbi:hypothetical protein PAPPERLAPAPP_02180 [Brevundimonas phage vB_BpoS-Papperlapapp]|uniref:Uncharacterized protein n=1 Tax=Brevundimonas phage vB_BpoS-Kabachok TaxID=2948600 RepID=A0A9E7MPS7_9CAUD|nr:hypothetical protein KABACHOK_00560 [Brevundimonas phage vB_BpoS-Kabachok]USN15959.1 hypothetical protein PAPPERLAPAPP_02180 [Brevundimonas phage vB_BpoS-Papperlapapp]